MKTLKIHHFNKKLSLSKELAIDLNGDLGKYIDTEDARKIFDAILVLENMAFKKTGEVSTVQRICEKVLGFIDG